MAEAVTFESLRRAIRAGNPAPVYLLHGKEGFFIDQLSRDIEALVPEADRDFNLTVLYAPQTEPAKVVEACRRYPMMADRQVVILREAQSGMPPRFGTAAYLKALAAYAGNPAQTTVLCVCFRGEEAKGAEFMKAIKAGGGVVFESVKMREDRVGAQVARFIQERGLSVDPKALAMLCDFVGTDLSRLYNEVGKLTVSLGEGAMVTPEAVERNIGVSKDYNNFEFVSALAARDEAKVMTILRYFRADPKNHPVQPLAVNIFTLFSNLLAAYYAADRSERGLMQELGFRWPGQLKDIRAAMRNYGPWHAIEIVQEIRRFDCRTKGVGSRQDPYDLLNDLAVRILHPLGQKGVIL